MLLFRGRLQKRPSATLESPGGVNRVDSGRRLRFFASCATIVLVAFATSALALTRAGAAPEQALTLTHVSPDQKAVAANVGSRDVPTISECRSRAYTLPSALPATSDVSGAYAQLDPAEAYSVHGTNPSEIMEQMRRCTPVHTEEDKFAANTGYTLSTYRDYTPGPEGLCHVSTIVVTVHINQIFPVWSDPADPYTTARWQNFIQNLQTHEQGHVDLDKAYAYKIYDTVRSVPPQDCATLSTNVDQVVQALTAELAQANDDYDAITKHGTLQGAVL